MSYKSLLIRRLSDGSYSVQADATRCTVVRSWAALRLLLDRLEHDTPEEIDEENIL